MCGRRKMEKEHPELCDWGDMPLRMVYKIAEQIPRGTVVQFHNNGEPTLYNSLGTVLPLFSHCIRQFNTNAKRLVEKAEPIIGNLDVLTISVIENDPDQVNEVRTFEAIKGDRPPRMIYRLLGDVDHTPWKRGQIVTRTLHLPEGSRGYHKPVTIPEHGICLDLLTHLAIDRYGDISLCVRFDPNKDLKLGNIEEMTLEEAWNSDKRQKYIKAHAQGKRAALLPGCGNLCSFYGVAIG